MKQVKLLIAILILAQSQLASALGGGPIEASKSLGDVVHLIQGTAHSQHTRIDPHAAITKRRVEDLIIARPNKLSELGVLSCVSTISIDIQFWAADAMGVERTHCESI